LNQQKNNLVGSVLVILAGLLWGVTGIFVRYLSALELDTMQVTFFKIAFATFVLLFYCVFFDREALKVKARDLWVFVCAGLVSLVFFTWCYFSTIQATSMSTAAILLYAAPIIVMLLSALLFREKITKRKALACGLAFVGCALVSGIVGNSTPLPISALITGILSAFGYALYSIFGKIAMNKGYRTETITTYTFIFATLGVGVFFRPSQVAAAATLSGNPAKFYGICILMSVVVSLLPYIFYTKGLERVPAGKASIMASIEPVMATVMGALVFHEIPDAFGFLGIVLVIAAIVLLNVHGKGSREEETKTEKGNGNEQGTVE